MSDSFIVQYYVNQELPDVQAGFRKGRGTRDQIANIRWTTAKAREFKKKITGREITCPGSWVVIGVEPGLHSKFMRFAGGGTAFREVQTQPSPSRSFQSTHSKKKKKKKQQASRNKVQAKGQLYCLH